jgi:hypothetical protein
MCHYHRSGIWDRIDPNLHGTLAAQPSQRESPRLACKAGRVTDAESSSRNFVQERLDYPIEPAS